MFEGILNSFMKQNGFNRLKLLKFPNSKREVNGMSEKIRSMFAISDEAMQDVTAKISALEDEGVKVNEAVSGEMNFAGCAKGYCQAWD